MRDPFACRHFDLVLVHYGEISWPTAQRNHVPVYAAGATDATCRWINKIMGGVAYYILLLGLT